MAAREAESRDREGGRWYSRELDIRGGPHFAAYERRDRDEYEIEPPHLRVGYRATRPSTEE